MSVTLYRCSPFSAWISPLQCAENAARGAAAAKAPKGSVDRLASLREAECCPGCVGVVERSEAEGVEPRILIDVERWEPKKAPAQGRKIVPGGGPDYVTTSEAARILGVTPQHTVQILPAAGAKPSRARSQGGGKLWRRTSVLKLRDARAQKKTNGHTDPPRKASPTPAPSDAGDPVSSGADIARLVEQKRDELQAEAQELRERLKKVEDQVDAFSEVLQVLEGAT